MIGVCYMQKNMLGTNRFWVLLLSAVILISAAALLLLRQAPASVARIYLDGELVDSVDLTAVTGPYTFTVEAPGGYNIVSVEQGRIRISDADCRDGSCVRQGWLSNGVIPIVCLPHGVVITLDGGGHLNIDAVVG